MKRTIFPYDFAPYYPVGIHPCPMYVDVANRIYELIKSIELDLPSAAELKKEIAINVAIYYEDKMSKIGLWNAFVARHLLTYQHPLPFFDDFENLAKDDVNAKEVELLIWLVLTRNFDDRFLNPLALGEYTANIIMEVLVEDDEVDVNNDLYDYIYNIDKANDYFKLKSILIWLRRSYLLCSPLSEMKFYELKDVYSQSYNKSESIYYAETMFCMNTEIGPMALLPNLCLADMYSENKMWNEAEKLASVKYCQQDIFEIVETDSNYVILKDSKKEEYKLKNTYPDLFRKGAYVCTALVKYGNNDWEINGIIFKSYKDVYDKMYERNEKLEYSYEHAFPLYMERTNGKRLEFFENTNQLFDWLRKVSPEINNKEIERQLPSGSQVAFISKKAGIVFAPNMIHAIKCDYNPYYNKCDAQTMQRETMEAVINIEVMHPELLNYLLKNKMLQNGDLSGRSQSELGNEIFTRNIDFIARHYRRHYYHDHDF